MKPAKEVAAEMVPSGAAYPCVVDGDDGIVLGCWDDADAVRSIIERLITRERAASYALGKANGAMEELERNDDGVPLSWPRGVPYPDCAR